MRLPPSHARHVFLRIIAMAMVVAGLLLARSNAATQQLTLAPAHLRFGAIPVGQSETQLVTLTNNGKANVSVTKITSSNAAFKISAPKLPQTLTAGQSITVNVTFKAASKGYQGGLITFAGSPTNATVRLGMGGAGEASEFVTPSPASVSFGTVKTGSSATIPVTVTNTHTWPVSLPGMQVLGGEFSVSGANFPMTLGGKKSVTLQVTFKPTTAGLTGGSAFFPGAALNIPFTGTGAGSTTGQTQLTISPAAMNFGNVVDGGTAVQTATVGASGGSVTISSVSSSNGQFSVPGETFPLTIPAGQSVSMQITFTPSASGTASGTLTFVDNATNSPSKESLSGTGTSPYVSLSWAPSTSQVSGYNVYRTTTPSGSYARMNSGLVASTSFKDSTVAAGKTYYYVTTAVNSSGQESGYSNQVQVMVQ
jgi:Abnormal spindle-like microcephaly-assoc'd, ASPM-SPD-2-Hydin